MRSTGDVKQSNLIREPDGSVAFLVDFVGPVLKGLDANTRSLLRSASATTVKW